MNNDNNNMAVKKTNDNKIGVPEELPFLKAICWQIRDVKRLDFREMLGLYEDGWHYLGVLGEPSLEELQFIKQLIQQYDSWLASDVCKRTPSQNPNYFAQSQSRFFS